MDTQRGVAESIAMIEHPDRGEFHSHEDSLPQFFETIHVVGSVDRLSLICKLLVDHTFCVEKDSFATRSLRRGSQKAMLMQSLLGVD